MSPVQSRPDLTLPAIVPTVFLADRPYPNAWESRKPPVLPGAYCSAQLLINRIFLLCRRQRIPVAGGASPAARATDSELPH